MSKMTAGELESLLSQCTGTEHYYQYMFGIKLTDGVKLLADNAGAYWLLDAIASYQGGKVKQIPFQVWKLERKGEKAELTMRQDSGQPIEIIQKIEYTDFPLESVELWLIDGVLILPSEY